ncbi:hypothetical protein H7H73_16690 [Mycobacterium rufum]|uniref:Uncharacterized protein n=1 Tax=Mycolicibacterium rufum TaxID=318424 RepID=A0A9X2YEF3_9MYCO|nr:hypothetical protein [Mycolicibacterium rufum]
MAQVEHRGQDLLGVVAAADVGARAAHVHRQLRGRHRREDVAQADRQRRERQQHVDQRLVAGDVGRVGAEHVEGVVDPPAATVFEVCGQPDHAGLVQVDAVAGVGEAEPAVGQIAEVDVALPQRVEEVVGHVGQRDEQVRGDVEQVRRGCRRGCRRRAEGLLGVRRLAERAGHALAVGVGGGGDEVDVHADGPDLAGRRGDG